MTVAFPGEGFADRPDEARLLLDVPRLADLELVGHGPDSVHSPGELLDRLSG